MKDRRRADEVEVAFRESKEDSERVRAPISRTTYKPQTVGRDGSSRIETAEL